MRFTITKSVIRIGGNISGIDIGMPRIPALGQVEHQVSPIWECPRLDLLTKYLLSGATICLFGYYVKKPDKFS